MIVQTLRGLAIFSAVGATLFVSPPESKAIFHWFRNRSRPQAVYQPVVAAPVCDPCAPQAVQYVPQTAYRARCVNVPVTTMQPVVSTDPCTGCPVTTYRPMTVYRRQVQLVPYTTYRIVRSPIRRTIGVAAPTAVAAPAAAGCCGRAPVAYGSPAAGVVGRYGQPAATYGTAVPSYGTPTPTYGVPSLSPTPAPSLPPSTAVPSSPEAAVPQTYQPNSATRLGTESLIPETAPATSNEQEPDDQQPSDIGPQLNAPASGTMTRPIPHTWTNRDVAWPNARTALAPSAVHHVASGSTAAAAATSRSTSPRAPRLDDSGWRASSR